MPDMHQRLARQRRARDMLPARFVSLRRIRVIKRDVDPEQWDIIVTEHWNDGAVTERMMGENERAVYLRNSDPT